METTPLYPKKIVLVLGSHRSGTSLLTAGLESLGAHLGIKKNASSDENKKGFFEHEGIVDFNERLLEFLGGHWDNPLFDGQKAIISRTKAELSPWLEEAKHIIQSNFNERTFSAIKDPRLCQLLPFWDEVLEMCGYDTNNIYHVHIARHPMEVAQSQHKRKKSNPDFYIIGENLLETVSLWFSLCYQTLKTTNSNNNIFVLYTELLDDPKTQLTRLANFLDITPQDATVIEFCESFVDKTMRRNIVSDEQNSILIKKFPEALELYKRQKNLADENSFSTQDANKVTIDFQHLVHQSNLVSPLTPLLSLLAKQRLQLTALLSHTKNEHRDLCQQIEKATQYRDQFQKELEQTAQHRDQLHQEFVAITHTLSWRLTTPLRKLRTWIIKANMIQRSAWLAIRNKARKTNLKLRSFAPNLSWLIASTLRPVFKILDKTFRISNYEMAKQKNGSTPLLSTDLYSNGQQLTENKTYNEPLVSIIVPNYNHEKFLRSRLESLYNQTYKNYEVILLDDCSTDSSQEILEEYRRKYPNKTKVISNKKNSGGVFYQWKRGIAAASGELIWIAESDDWCTNNFLETLVSYFNNDAVMLAYCRTTFMDEAGSKEIWSIEQYLADINTALWQKPFLKPAHQLVSEAWAIKNIVPNVSSALFRHPGNMELLENTDWQHMRICGDWMFYLHIIRGGIVAYSPYATNYYRIHQKNTSSSTYSKDSYYKEHEEVSICINRLYSVPNQVFHQQRSNIKQHWIDNRPSFSEADLDRCYNISVIEHTAKERKPNLLMVGYAFAAGGGETFPIQLANLLKADGYGITFLSCDQEKREPKIRTMLRQDIPVLNQLHALDLITVDFGLDIIHSHHAWVDGAIMDLLSAGAKCQTVVSLHGMYETIDDRDLKRILPRLLSKTAKLVVTADKNLGPFQKHGLTDSHKFAKISNALPIYPGKPISRDDLGIPKTAFVLCLVSRAIPEKGWQEAIDSVNLARQTSGADIHLVLIGEGNEYSKLVNSPPPKHVHLLGFKENIRDYYATSDMGYLPSRFKGESYPLTIIDCLHAGTPVLASDVGEISKMLDADGKIAGNLFTLNNWNIPVAQVAEIIVRCATDKAYYEQIRQSVPLAAKKFDPSVMLEKYHAVYTKITAHTSEPISDATNS